MSRYGMGTGRHATRHLRDAQNHFEMCMSAIPAWVMPLHRVFETISPASGMFDVVIVDEASQCGPDALPLLFLGKKMIVVGDDKQISPDGGFVNQDNVASLRSTYLNDFEFSSAFQLTTSLFSHGERLFGNPIVLTDHFRCMPEIIRFSDALCYSANPLIPLRQYPPDRLEPLRRFM